MPGRHGHIGPLGLRTSRNKLSGGKGTISSDATASLTSNLLSGLVKPVLDCLAFESRVSQGALQTLQKGSVSFTTQQTRCFSQIPPPLLSCEYLL